MVVVQPFVLDDFQGAIVSAVAVEAIKDFVRGIAPTESSIEMDCETVPELRIDSGKATSVALVVAELLTNAVKHAFPERRSGTIRVTLRRSDGVAQVTIADDGIGMPNATGRSAGVRIVESLVTQMGGTIARETDTGTTHVITLPLTDPSG